MNQKFRIGVFHYKDESTYSFRLISDNMIIKPTGHKPYAKERVAFEAAVEFADANGLELK